MPDRIDVQKTYKLFVNGAFPRSESGRTAVITSNDGSILGHACRASRKDLRDAVLAARAGLGKWKSATAYNRAQVLYRLAEMLQTRRAEFIDLLTHAGEADAHEQFAASIDRAVYFAGWADKWTHILGTQNPVAGPYWNLSTPEPVGVVAIACPAAPALLPMLSLMLPVLATGAACVLLTPAFAPIPSTLGEVLATCDLPPGTANILTADLADLLPVVAKHRDIDAVLAAGLTDEHARTLQEGAAENLKRVTILPGSDWLDHTRWQTLATIEALAEIKTVWHPVGW
jgi:acyl-CoA reductase-like NAD-dependent aldehyde dehydrogenase